MKLAIFKETKIKYFKGKINELERNSKKRNIRDMYRGINEFKKGYQPRSNFIKGWEGDLFADSNTILNRWKNHFYVIECMGLMSLGKQIRTAQP
jgi:hypothetical protein